MVVPKEEFKVIEIKKIMRADNSRLTYKKEDLSDLMSSIQQDGLIHPIVVAPMSKKKGHFKLIAGNRRVEAFVKLGKRTIQAKIIKSVSKKDERIINIAENVQRKEPNEFSLGRYYSNLKKDFNMTISEVAARVGVSVPSVKKSITIFEKIDPKFSKDVAHCKGGVNVKKGKIPGTVAEKIVNLSLRYPNVSKKDENKLLMKAKKDEISMDHLRQLMSLLNQNVPFTKAIKKLDKIKTIRIDFPVSLEEYKEFKKTIAKKKSVNQEIIDRMYSGKAIKFSKPV